MKFRGRLFSPKNIDLEDRCTNALRINTILTRIWVFGRVIVDEHVHTNFDTMIEQPVFKKSKLSKKGRSHGTFKIHRLGHSYQHTKTAVTPNLFMSNFVPSAHLDSGSEREESKSKERINPALGKCFRDHLMK